MNIYKSLILSILIIFSSASISFAEDIEYLNDQMLAFANKNMGKKIGRGECWDLVAGELRALGANWDGRFTFGKKIGGGNVKGLKMETDFEIKPGDIIQFRQVKTSWKKTYPDGRRAWGSETLGMPDHTAIVKEFDGKTIIKLLHQNVNGKRYIVETNFETADVKSGTYIIYRAYRIKKDKSTE